jgi:hypothetical protein
MQDQFIHLIRQTVEETLSEESLRDLLQDLKRDLLIELHRRKLIIEGSRQGKQVLREAIDAWERNNPELMLAAIWQAMARFEAIERQAIVMRNPDIENDTEPEE